MRFYVIYRYSWPDCAPYARILKAFTEKLMQAGHKVTVFCGQPSYNDVRHARRPWREVESGVEYVRMPLLWEQKRVAVSRVLNSMIFCLGALLYGLFARRMDATMTETCLPVIAGTAARLVARARKSRLIYHCQDLHPEVALAGGILKEGFTARIMAALDAATVQSADLVIVLSEEMAESIRARGVDGKNIEILNNFAYTCEDGEVRLPDALRRRPDTFRVLFAGNHGPLQGLEHVIAAAHVLKSNPSIRFEFIGEGAAKSRLIALAGDMVGKTVSFHPHVPEEQIFRVMQESDLGIVSLRPEIYKYAFPSKVGTLLSSGCPLLALVEAESSLARLVVDEGLGYVCEPGDVSAIVASICEAYRQRNARPSCEHLRAVAVKHMGRAAVLERWSQIVDQRCIAPAELSTA